MIVEENILNAVRDRLVAQIPALEGRVLTEPKPITDIRYWPCVMLDMPSVTYTTGSGREGKRPRKGDGILAISLADDGNKPSAVSELREISDACDKAIMLDPFLEDLLGKALVSALTLEQSATTTMADNGVNVAVRQLIYSVIFRTVEGSTGTTTQ